MNEKLKAFVDNELPETERVQILKEIESRPDLQAEVIELRQISKFLKDHVRQPEPVGLERTLDALSRKATRPFWSSPLALVGAGACCFILAAFLFPVFAQSKFSARSAERVSAASAPVESKADDGVSLDTLQAPGSIGGGGKARAKSEISSPEGRDVEVPVSSPSISAQPRYQIKTANLSVEVDDVVKAQSEAEKIARAVGGRVESSQKNNDEGSLASAELTFRVPVGSFEAAIERIRKLGRVLNDALTGEDVTAQVMDTQARLKVMRAEEDQYVELLKATKRIGEVLSVKERLSQVRQEIEGLDAQQKVLRSQAAESTINLSLKEKAKVDRPKQNEGWIQDVWANAVSGLNGVGRGLGSAAIFLFVFSPIWLPIVLIGWWLHRKARTF